MVGGNALACHQQSAASVCTKKEMWVKIREGAKVDAHYDVSPTLEYRVVELVFLDDELRFVIVNDDGDVVAVSGEHFRVSGSDHETYSRMTGEAQALVEAGRYDLLPKKSA